jgi:NCAIR mutase (PurE)-related protein
MSDTEVNLDFDRQSRTGLAEAVLCEGKSLAQLQTICSQIQAAAKPMLFTRLDLPSYQALEKTFPGLLAYDPSSATAFHLARTPLQTCPVAIVTGGSSDANVANEAARTLQFYGHEPLQINDVGVAGLWRLQARLAELQQQKIIICIAGMDAALPTVLGGLVPGILIAVPTATGYGMARGGETALHSLLVSCAPGITVVNINNGFGAACAAIRALNQISQVTQGT